MVSLRLPGARRASLNALLLFAALLTAGAAQALSLGDAILQSRLGDPLRVSIPLGRLGSLGENDIVVGRAPNADYTKYGVERVSTTSSLRFALRVESNGNASVEVSTEQPFTEPLLDMVVEVRWPAGRLVRQYSLLLDLPRR